jgi:hypothetical protein
MPKSKLREHYDKINEEERRKAGRPQLPSATAMVINFGKAVVKHAQDGFKRVTLQQYQERLTICNKNKCGYRLKNRCTHPACGCFLDKKAWWNSENCPVGDWPELESDENGV